MLEEIKINIESKKNIFWLSNLINYCKLIKFKILIINLAKPPSSLFFTELRNPAFIMNGNMGTQDPNGTNNPASTFCRRRSPRARPPPPPPASHLTPHTTTRGVNQTFRQKNIIITPKKRTFGKIKCFVYAIYRITEL